ncbi:MAG: hypothetical protein AMK72_03985 [Planctomycetes bacterium SM23_25]|nr:MAG: hypothetical protein AMK72_03985 [Planctomycetes bacterium SM23_25]
MTTALRALGIAAVLVGLLAVTPSRAANVEVGKHVVLIQGFEGKDVFEKKEHVSYLSGVPEDAEVEVWDANLYRRRKFPPAESGIACGISARHRTQGRASLEVRFSRPDRVLRVSLCNNINQPANGGRPACNSIGCFDWLRGDVFNPGRKPVELELTMLGGFAVTDNARTFSLVRSLTLKPGWNEFAVSSQEASATFVDPHDATCVEFRTPATPDAVLYFDNFRMERETIGKNMTALAKCFDFGVSWFNWPGFTYGSLPWDEGRGFGFTQGSDLTHGGDLHVINDQLTRDGFRAPASFRVKLPNGRYKVVTQTGNYWAQRDGGLNIEIKAEGKRVYYRPKMSAAKFIRFKYAHERTDHWKRDMDLWGTYEEGTYLRTVTFQTEVADGALDLDFLLPPVEDGRPHGVSIWTYLIVYPADKERLIAPELEWLNEKIRTVYNKVSHAQISRQFALYNREEVICPEEFLWPDLAAARRAALKPTDTEAARGYLHFLRHHHDLVSPDSVPLPNEIGDAIAVFGTPGETVQWAVGLYPLKHLKDVSVSLGNFQDESGKPVTAAAAADVRLVSYRPMTPVTSNHAECFHYVGPGILIPAAATDIPAGFPRNWWISLPIPKGIGPGLYRGRFNFKLAGRDTSSVEVALRVLPFELQEPQGVTFAVDYRTTMSFRPEDGPHELDFFRSLGINTLWYQGGPDQLPELQQAAGKAGLTVEIGHPDKYPNWRWPQEYRQALIQRYLAKGQGVSFQPRHTGYREGRRTRFTHGFWLWRSGIRHRVIQTQPNAAERVYYAHYGHAKFGPCNYLFPSLDGVGKFNPAPTLLEVRDGIYDWRYIQTLEGLVRPKGADLKATPAIERGRACLDELKAAVNPDLDHYYFERKRNFNHVGRFGLHDTVWNGRRYQMERWAIARHVAALKGAELGGRTEPLHPAAPAGPILFAEHFGPFWVDESQYLDFMQQREGTPSILLETPKTPAARNWVTALVKMRYPSKRHWLAVLTDAAGKELARQNVGLLERWKTRWVLRTEHLPVGKYALRILPADSTVKLDSEIKADFEVLPGIE